MDITLAGAPSGPLRVLLVKRRSPPIPNGAGSGENGVEGGQPASDLQLEVRWSHALLVKAGLRDNPALCVGCSTPPLPTGAMAFLESAVAVGALYRVFRGHRSFPGGGRVAQPSPGAGAKRWSSQGPDLHGRLWKARRRRWALAEAGYLQSPGNCPRNKGHVPPSAAGSLASHG